MKQIICLSMLFALLWFNGTSQSSVRFYGGFNVSSAKYYYTDLTTQTDSTYNHTPYLFPTLGMQYNIEISDKFDLATGLGISYVGARNYITNVPAEFNLDNDLKLGYLQLPLGCRYKINKSLFLLPQYILNYNFRKNQSFYTEGPSPWSSIELYNYFYHEAGLTLFFSSNRLDVVLQYAFGLSPIWDTKDLNPLYSARLTMYRINFSIGYSIFDE